MHGAVAQQQQLHGAIAQQQMHGAVAQQQQQLHGAVVQQQQLHRQHSYGSGSNRARP